DVIARGVPQVEVFSVPAADGSTRQYECIKVPLHGSNGAIDGTLTAARDITERLRAQAELRMWAHAFENAAFSVAIYDVDSERLIAVNAAFAGERGYSPAEMVGMDINALYPAERQQELASLRRD